MKNFTKATVLIVLIMVLGTVLHAKGDASRSIKLNETDAVGTPLEILLYTANSPLPIVAGTTTTQANGEFIEWSLPSNWPDVVFRERTRAGYNFTTTKSPNFALTRTTTAQPPSNLNAPGAGLSEENPLLISNLANLRWLSENESMWGNPWVASSIKRYFLQTADIDASETITWNEGTGFSPIGQSLYEPWRPFSSNYDGGNFVITK